VVAVVVVSELLAYGWLGSDRSFAIWFLCGVENHEENGFFAWSPVYTAEPGQVMG